MNDAWLAGVLEGEGSFSVNPKGHVRITCNMTDEDVVDSLRKVACAGYVSGPRTIKQGWKPIWTWRVNRYDDVKEVLLRIKPYMHSRRAAKIDELLEACNKLEAARSLPRGVNRANSKKERYNAMYSGEYLGTFATVVEAKAAYIKRRKESFVV